MHFLKGAVEVAAIKGFYVTPDGFDIPLRHRHSGIGASVLLRQPHGLEGFSLVLCLLDAHYESVAQLEDEGPVLPKRDAARFPRASRRVQATS